MIAASTRNPGTRVGTGIAMSARANTAMPIEDRQQCDVARTERVSAVDVRSDASWFLTSSWCCISRAGRASRARECARRCHQRTSAEPHEMPAPSAHIRMVWPGLIFPSETASSSAMGIDALEVLPYLWMLSRSAPSGRSRRCETPDRCGCSPGARRPSRPPWR